MSNIGNVLTSDFKGKSLNTYTFKGKPCWIAREVGALMGYLVEGDTSRDGERLVNLIRQDWKKEFTDGKHYIILRGKDLANFKELVKLHTYSVCSLKHAHHLMLLLEPGFHRATLMTDKPIGKEMRDHLDSEVMPQLARDGNYIKGRTVDDERAPLQDMPEDAIILKGYTLLMDRNAKLTEENKRLTSVIEEDASKVQAYHEFINCPGTVTMSEAAKILAVGQMGRNNLFAFLRRKGVLFGVNNEPYQKYIKQGWFRVSANPIPVAPYTKPQTLVTRKGIDSIAILIRRDQLQLELSLYKES